VFDVYKGRASHVVLCLDLLNFPESKALCGVSYLYVYKLKSVFCWYYYVMGFIFTITCVSLVVGKCQGLVKFNEFTQSSLKLSCPP
jgi:hypothetical protein